MAKNIMTNREFFQAVAELVEYPALVEKAESELEKMDAALERRKNSPANKKKAEENRALAEHVLPVLSTDKELTASEIKNLVNEATGENYSTQKVTAILKVLEEDKKINKVFPEQRNKPAVYTLR